MNTYDDTVWKLRGLMAMILTVFSLCYPKSLDTPIAAPVRHTVTLACSQIPDCKYLQQAIYYEARGESVEGMISVMSVIKNRAKHPSKRWPNSIPAVVKQGCEFSYRCDGSMQAKKDKKAWRQAELLAITFITNDSLHEDTESLFYHKEGLRKPPKWSMIHTQTKRVGNHIFFDCSTKYC